jgi:fructokinase
VSSPSPNQRVSPASASPSVLVIGEALIDIVSRAGHPDAEHVGGSPANVALGLGRLGVPVRLHTALAHDPRGERIAAHLAASGVAIDPASWSLQRTSSAIARIGQDGAANYDFDIDWSLPTPPALTGAQVVHVGSIAAFLEPGATVLEEFLTSIGGSARVTFDPNIRPALVGDRDAARERVQRIAGFCDVVKLSDEDAAWLYPGETIDDVLDQLLSFGPQLTAVSLGGHGATLASATHRVTVPAPTVDVVDTVGAGDTFTAALIDALLTTSTDTHDERYLRELGNHAASAAAITVQRAGANLPTRTELHTPT